MTHSPQVIPITHLALGFIPALLVIYVIFHWQLEWKNALYAVARMLLQLLLVGYFLAYLFGLNHPLVMLLVLAIMVGISSWIALRTVEEDRHQLLGFAYLSIGLGGGLTLVLVIFGVLRVAPWYEPRFLIPLAGMIFANAMTTVSLAAERYYAERKQGQDYARARAAAYKASMIPITNSLFAVGLVALPGMMTGQILSGVSPLIAARYQIMVMAMLFGASGLSSALFLVLLRRRLRSDPQ